MTRDSIAGCKSVKEELLRVVKLENKLVEKTRVIFLKTLNLDCKKVGMITFSNKTLLLSMNE